MTGDVALLPDAATPEQPVLDEIVDQPTPTWVKRMHGDGLPTTDASSEEPPETGSRRFIDHWQEVAGGY